MPGVGVESDVDRLNDRERGIVRRSALRENGDFQRQAGVADASDPGPQVQHFVHPHRRFVLNRDLGHGAVEVSRCRDAVDAEPQVAEIFGLGDFQPAEVAAVERDALGVAFLPAHADVDAEPVFGTQLRHISPAFRSIPGRPGRRDPNWSTGPC